MPRFSVLLLISSLLGGFAAIAQDPPSEATPSEAPAGEEGPAVLESAICAGVEEHAPVGEAESFAPDVDRIFCWTRIGGGEGSTVVHAWIHEGVTRARVELSVGSDDWRTYSSKRILPAWTGNWEVKVLTPDGAVLKTIPFQIR